MDLLLHIVFVGVCLFLILVVLLQSGKGGGLGALSGGGGSNTVFGGAGAGNFLSRMTAVCAALFMILSAVLAYRSSTGDEAVDRAIDEKIAESEKPELNNSDSVPASSATPKEEAVEEVEETSDEPADQETAPVEEPETEESAPEAPVEDSEDEVPAE